MDEFPLYWTEEPHFQGARGLEDLPQSDQEVCQFLSILKVIWHCLFHKQRVHPRGSKSLYWYFSFPTLDRTNLAIVADYLLFSFADNMLAKIVKK